MFRSSGGLRVSQASRKRRDRALTIAIFATGHGSAITPEENCVIPSGSDLRKSQPSRKRRKGALSLEIRTKCHGRAVALEKNNVETASDREHIRGHEARDRLPGKKKALTALLKTTTLEPIKTTDNALLWPKKDHTCRAYRLIQTHNKPVSVKTIVDAA